MNKKEQENVTKEKKNNDLNFSVAFKKDGDSFQDVMEKILMSKIVKNQ